MTTNRPSGLGRGLDALIPGPGGDRETSGVVSVDIDALEPNPMQPREHWDDEELEELSRSILEHGVIQPIIVTRSQGKTPYRIIAGERRWRASKLAGLTSLPVLIRDATTLQALELAIVENVQRADLNPVEEALAYRQLIDEFDFTQEEVAQRVGKSRPGVANTLRLLDAPSEIRQAIVDGRISAGHGRALLAIESNDLRLQAFQTVLKRKLNVRQTEQLTKKSTRTPTAKVQPASLVNPEISALENSLRASLGTRVKISQAGTGGRIVISYYSDEELTSIVEKISGSSDW